MQKVLESFNLIIMSPTRKLEKGITQLWNFSSKRCHLSIWGSGFEKYLGGIVKGIICRASTSYGVK